MNLFRISFVLCRTLQILVFPSGPDVRQIVAWGFDAIGSRKYLWSLVGCIDIWKQIVFSDAPHLNSWLEPKLHITFSYLRNVGDACKTQEEYIVVENLFVIHHHRPALIIPTTYKSLFPFLRHLTMSSVKSTLTVKVLKKVLPLFMKETDKKKFKRKLKKIQFAYDNCITISQIPFKMSSTNGGRKSIFANMR